jgi:hypothetical protein
MTDHRRTFDLLGIEPPVSEASVRQLDELERHRGITLPASVREWYVRDGAVARLSGHRNEDHASPIAELGQPLTHAEGAPFDAVAHGLLPVLVENQAVCTWAVCLDGTEDPPVVVAVDGQLADWRPHAETFSAFVYGRLWDHAVALARPHMITAPLPSLMPGVLAALREAFDEEPMTEGFPGDVQHRFGGADRSILIWAERNGPSDWMLTADTPEALEALVQAVAPLVTLDEHACGNSAESEALLGRLRAERLRR